MLIHVIYFDYTLTYLGVVNCPLHASCPLQFRNNWSLCMRNYNSSLVWGPIKVHMHGYYSLRKICHFEDQIYILLGFSDRVRFVEIES